MNEQTKKYFDQQFAMLPTRSELEEMKAAMATKDDLEKLAIMVSNSFSHVQGQLTAINEKIEPLAKQVAQHESRLDYLDTQVQKLAAA